MNLLTAGAYCDHGGICASVRRMHRDLLPLAGNSRHVQAAVALLAIIDSGDEDMLDPERVSQRLRVVRREIRALRLSLAGQ